MSGVGRKTSSKRPQKRAKGSAETATEEDLPSAVVDAAKEEAVDVAEVPNADEDIAETPHKAASPSIPASIPSLTSQCHDEDEEEGMDEEEEEEEDDIDEDTENGSPIREGFIVPDGVIEKGEKAPAIDPRNILKEGEKRRRTAPQRFVPKNFVSLMFADVPPSEIPAALGIKPSAVLGNADGDGAMLSSDEDEESALESDVETSDGSFVEEEDDEDEDEEEDEDEDEDEDEEEEFDEEEFEDSECEDLDEDGESDTANTTAV
jgi:hypothetical protein